MRIEQDIQLGDVTTVAALKDRVQRVLRRLTEAVNSNDGSPMIEEASSLPTASAEYHGRLMMLKRDGAANDTLHWCRQDSGGAYSWQAVA